MPTPNFGYSFEPNAENAERARMGGAPGAQPQGAIQTLNYRLPRVTGAAGLSPLVGQNKVGSSFGGAVLQSVLRTVLGAQQASALMGGEDSSLGGDDRRTTDPGSAILEQLSRGSMSAPTFPGPSGPPSAPSTPDPVVIPGDDDRDRSGGSSVPEPPAFEPPQRNPRFDDKYAWEQFQ